jgi:hypothetical protein
MLAQEFVHEARLAHALGPEQQQTGHAVAWRIREEIRQAVDDLVGAWVVNPAFLPNPVDPLVGGEASLRAVGGVEVESGKNLGAVAG